MRPVPLGGRTAPRYVTREDATGGRYGGLQGQRPGERALGGWKSDTSRSLAAQEQGFAEGWPCSGRARCWHREAGVFYG